MIESIATMPSEAIAAYIGIDWADEKHVVALRSAAESAKIEHRLGEQRPEALAEWIGQLGQPSGWRGKILVCLEQSRGALIYHLMGFELFDLCPLNPLHLAR